jgi:Ser/Thr protein kinase RdoA (MazF antagonist)
MMRLKYLIEEQSSTYARAAFHCWPNDPGSLAFFRASANIQYAFRFHGKSHFLRLSPHDERSFGQIRAELDFIAYLRSRGYPANRPVPSISGHAIQVIPGTSGPYYAVVFEAVPGHQLDQTTMSADDYRAWGASLAELHALSRDYRPMAERRMSFVDQLTRIYDTLSSYPDEELAMSEIHWLSGKLVVLPASPDVYGLIHYDFQPDNVFCDPVTHALSVIDFDDSLYHFYAQDIVCALMDTPGQAERGYFVEGYSANGQLSQESLRLMPVFRRYASIVQYGRIMHALKDAARRDDIPWYPKLQEKLLKRCSTIRKGLLELPR